MGEKTNAFSRDEYDAANCSVARALEVVGERWAFLVLRESFYGVRRFDQFQRNLGIARNILTSRLQTLVGAGILERTLYNERPKRYEYRLTQKGLDLYPVVVSLMQWGDRYAADPAGPPIVLEHKGCGKITTPKFVCSNCGEEVGARDIRARPGPGVLQKSA